MDMRGFGLLIFAACAISMLADRAMAQDAPAACVLQPDDATHQLPPFPASVPKGSYGFTTLWATINADGTVLDVSLDHSSGSDALDDAAQAYVKQNWKWKASAPECGTIPVRTRVAIGWTG